MRVLIRTGMAAAVSSLLMGTLLASPAQAGILDECLEISGGSGRLTGSGVELTASVYSTCETFGRWVSGGISWTVPEEPQTLSLSFKCDGPSLSEAGLLRRKYLGQVKCVIKTTGWGKTSRVGAISSSIRAWTAWDFSSRELAIRHPAIPDEPSSSGDSGSGGSSGGTVVSPSPCETSPEKPRLTGKFRDGGGVEFRVEPLEQQQQGLSLTYYIGRKGEETSEWQASTQQTSWADKTKPWTLVLEPEVGVNYVWVRALLSNSCVSTISDAVSLPLRGTRYDSIVRSDTREIFIGEAIHKEKVAKSQFNLTVDWEVLTPKTCTFEGEAIKPLALGQCGFRLSGWMDRNTAPAPVQEISLDVRPERAANHLTQILQTLVVGQAPMDANLLAKISVPTELTMQVTSPDTCLVTSSRLVALARGTCTVTLSSPGSQTLRPLAESLTIQIVGRVQDTSSIPRGLKTGGSYKTSVLLESLPVKTRIRSQTPEFCQVKGGRLTTLRRGACRLALSNDGSHAFEPLDASIAIRIR